MPLVGYEHKAAFDRPVAFEQRAIASQIFLLVKGGMRVFFHAFLHEAQHYVLLAVELGELPVEVGGIGQDLYDIGMGLQDFILIGNQAVEGIYKRLLNRSFVQLRRFAARPVFVFMISLLTFRRKATPQDEGVLFST